MPNLVSIARYRDLSEAIVARTLIESAGMTVYLYDENLVRLDWQISNFIGGIRLQVKDEDQAEATEILNQPIVESIDFGSEIEFTQPECPRCGSIKISFQGASRKAAIASLWILSIPLPLGRETWRCDACGLHWEDTESP